MQGFYQEHNAVFWSQNNEIVRIEPWGRDSLRVRASINGVPRDDLFGVLLPPVETEVQIHITQDGATICNGAITAHVSQRGVIRFV